MSLPTGEEKGEQELADLIRQAGESARLLQAKTLARHFARLKTIAEAVQQRDKDALHGT